MAAKTVADELRRISRMLAVPQRGWSSSIPPAMQMTEARRRLDALVKRLDVARALREDEAA